MGTISRRGRGCLLRVPLSAQRSPGSLCCGVIRRRDHANGFQMGRIPCIGYRRVSVSADGQSRTPISNGYRKLTATDRIAWVLGPEHEVELVRRIFRLYAARAQTTWGIWKISQREGWTDAAGFPITRARI